MREFKRSEIVHNNPYFQVIKSEVFDHGSGARLSYHSLNFPMPSVGVLLIREDDCVLLIKQHRFIANRWVWGLPLGGVESTETMFEAGRRELLEETGFEVRSLRHLVSFCPSIGSSNQVFHCLEGREPESIRAPGTDETEATRWCSRDSVATLISSGAIADGFSLVPLLHWLAALPNQSTTVGERLSPFIPELAG